MIEIIKQANEQETIFILKGRIDTMTSPEIESSLIKEVEQGVNKLTVDMQHISYISSAGLRVFLHVAKKLNHSKERLTIQSLIPQVKEVFDISGLTDFFNIQ